MAISSTANDTSFVPWASAHESLHLDLGTGDGTFVVRTARSHPHMGVVGVDTCLDHLRGAARNRPANSRFVQADARTLPPEFTGRFGGVSINFPFGVLLRSLFDGDADLVASLDRVSASATTIDIVVNESAIRRAGISVDEGTQRLLTFARHIPGGRMRYRHLDAASLRSFPSAWARRMGYGRLPQAVHLQIVRT